MREAKRMQNAVRTLLLGIGEDPEREIPEHVQDQDVPGSGGVYAAVDQI